MNSILMSENFYLFNLMIFMYFLGFLNLILNYFKLMNILVLIEYMVLNLFFLTFLMLSYENGYNFLIYFLVSVVCEGAMGLSILISMIRLGGNLKLKSYSFYMC